MIILIGKVNYHMNTNINHLMKRRSIRKFKPEQIKKEELDSIIEAGLYAASGMNRQAPIVIAVQDKAIRDELAKLNASVMGRDGDPFYGAPTVLVVLADKSIPTYIYDGSLMIGNLMQAAYELGIGSCWIHRAKQEFETPFGKELLKKLGIEGDYEGIGNVILGYPDMEAETKPRRENRVYYL